MAAQVGGEEVVGGEGGAAHHALTGPHLPMTHHVDITVLGRGVADPAHGAPVGLALGVCALVGRQVAALGKLLAAGVAAEGLHPGVGAQVDFEGVGPGEVHAALPADVLLLPGGLRVVVAHVRGQVAGAHEHRAADVAGVGAVTGKALHLQFQGGRGSRLSRGRPPSSASPRSRGAPAGRQDRLEYLHVDSLAVFGHGDHWLVVGAGVLLQLP